MADADWKKRIGIAINFSSSDDDDKNDSRVELRPKTPNTPINNNSGANPNRRNAPLALHFPAEGSPDDIVARYAEYGSTPPRTRIKNKTRDWDRKSKQDTVQSPTTPTSTLKMKVNNSRMSRSRVNRRNTMDCALLNEMFVEDGDKTKRQVDKRAITISRGEDRDSKLLMLNVPPTIPERASPMNLEERVESLPGNWRPNRISNNNLIIESANRYMCVTSRPVEHIGTRMSAPPATFLRELATSLHLPGDAPRIQTRKEFHETFANLIKLGTTDKADSKISQDEHKYQTELKDLIWLELQAWHADRTLDQQDKFLFAARQNVSDLLTEIMDYKFVPRYSRNVSVVSDDSGFAPDSASSASGQEFKFPSNDLRFHSTHCPGCFSMYCKDCTEQQDLALRQVEALLTRLEKAESLFPSTNSMGHFYPVYRDDKFLARLKTMCLWYNITRHHRLKLLILGKILSRLQGKQVCWPVAVPINSTAPSPETTDDSGRESNESKGPRPPCKVRFSVAETPPPQSSESNASLESLKEQPSVVNPPEEEEVENKFEKWVNQANTFNAHTIPDNGIFPERGPYRRYIEDVLKSRGLGKSLAFLHRVHSVVMKRAQIALTKPGTEEHEHDDEGMFEDEEMSVMIDRPVDKEEREELQKFGAYSNEYKELNLPSYASGFVFLSMIPMEVIHEFLRMKLESRPVKPNPLSLEQLLKELREGIILAITHRERFNKHIMTALVDREEEMERYLKILNEFNNTLRTVFEGYLDYVEQMIMAASSEGQQKAVLDREWMFTKLVCPMVPGQHAVAANKFCSIVISLLMSIGDRLVKRGTELDEKIEVSDQATHFKSDVLIICREMQTLFTDERERSLKVMTFAKGLLRDIEHSDFHRDHSEDFLDKCKENDFVCDGVREAVCKLKTEALRVREKLSAVLGRVQERCDVNHIHMTDIDDADKTGLLSRAREILHQGYKFGFEYHRDLMRLMESRSVVCKDSKKDLTLSLGIISFAKMWMTFVRERCERGRGLRPRWAAQGFDFLSLACDPANSQHLSEKEFEEMKIMMDSCISHVIGLQSQPQRKRPSPRARKNSPAAPGAPQSPPVLMTGSNSLSLSTKSLYQQTSLFEEGYTGRNSVPQSPEIMRKQQSCDNSLVGDQPTLSLRVPQLRGFTQALRVVRVRDAINRLDLELENKMREKSLIGQVKSLNANDKIHIRARSVQFRWHRGIKLGQGRFGKVYTAVNNSTGELMAMKEIQIQPGESRAIQMVAEELKIFEGIKHPHLVKYFGVEIHREELLLFMELCSEGTLESLIELSGGLPEGLTRRFTVQLLSATAELHKHGIVHRDIKTANIFLTNGTNCLKLGDFGSAVKIQSHTTVVGELQGLVGTQAYMAPEVFTRTNTEGHGRAVDIWSIGCVIIEMASGKRPWSQFETTVQIMFKVGMGARPEIPGELSAEGHELLDRCLQHEPKNRATAAELLSHTFCKVVQDDSCGCSPNTGSIKKGDRRGSRGKSKSTTPERKTSFK